MGKTKIMFLVWIIFGLFDLTFVTELIQNTPQNWVHTKQITKPMV